MHQRTANEAWRGYFGFDDAIYASCRLIEILAKTKQSLSSLVADLPQTTVTPEIRVDCPDSVKFQLVDQVRTQLSSYLEAGKPVGASNLTMRELVTIDGVRAIFEDGSRVSNRSARRDVPFIRESTA